MNEDLKKLETPILIDMLAKHTEDYTKLMTEGTREAFEQCNANIGLIQNEINSRKQTPDNTTISDTDISFTA